MSYKCVLMGDYIETAPMAIISLFGIERQHIYYYIRKNGSVSGFVTSNTGIDDKKSIWFLKHIEFFFYIWSSFSINYKILIWITLCVDYSKSKWLTVEQIMAYCPWTQTHINTFRQISDQMNWMLSTILLLIYRWWIWIFTAIKPSVSFIYNKIRSIFDWLWIQKN